MGTLLALLVVLLGAPAAHGQSCGKEGVALQVLGSGGPIAQWLGSERASGDDARASSGYLLWHDGQARVLVDAGGGVFVRFGEAGARIEDLDLVALTHFHTDHAADLPALMKGGYFSSRTRPLAVSGPDGNRLMPGIGEFLEAMFAAEHGAFRYLSGFIDGTQGLFALEPIMVSNAASDPVEVWQDDTMAVHAVGVHHGPIPTLSYSLVLEGHRIVIGGDQNLSTGHLASLAADADLLVMPMAIPEEASAAARNLHATPTDIGRFAADVAPRRLVLSHLMERSLRNLAGQVARVREHYDGPLTVAEDLQCFDLGAQRAPGASHPQYR